MSLRSPALPILIVAGLLSGCGDPQVEVTATEYHVVDRFDVGSGIYVRALAVEPSTGTLWVGTSMGVMEIDAATRELRNTFTRQDGLANEYVFAIGIDRRGYKWFGTNAGGASRYKDGNWDVYFPMHGLADYWIYAFAEQRNGVYWIGTWDGANRVDLETMEFSKYKEELINEWVYGLAVDSQDRVWFGTEGGVSMFDGNEWFEWNHDDGVGAPNEAALPVSRNTGLGTRERHDLSVLARLEVVVNDLRGWKMVQPVNDRRACRQYRIQRRPGPDGRVLVRYQPWPQPLRRQDIQQFHRGFRATG